MRRNGETEKWGCRLVIARRIDGNKDKGNREVTLIRWIARRSEFEYCAYFIYQTCPYAKDTRVSQAEFVDVFLGYFGCLVCAAAAVLRAGGVSLVFLWVREAAPNTVKIRNKKN